MSRNALLFSMQGLRGASPCVCYHSPQEPFRFGVERVPAGADGGSQTGTQAGRDAGGSVHQPLMMQMPIHAVNGEVVEPSMYIDAPQLRFTCGGCFYFFQNRMGMHGVHVCLHFCTLCACFFFFFFMAVDLLAVKVVSFREKAQEAPLGFVAHLFFFVFFFCLAFSLPSLAVLLRLLVQPGRHH